MKRTVGFTASLFALLLAFTASALAQNETYTAAVRLSSAAEINPPVPVPANAAGGILVTVSVTRDTNGEVTGGAISFLGTVSIPDAERIVGLHIHEADIVSNGGIRFDTGISGANPVPLTNGTGLVNANVATVDVEALKRLLAKPSGFYVNVHTEDNTAGAIRGQILKLTETLSNTVAMTTDQEVNPPQPLPDNASGNATITIHPVRNPATGEITGGTVLFTVHYDLPPGSVIRGLHIHKAPAGDNGGVVIDTGLGPSNSITTETGKGTINIEVPVNASNELALMSLRELVQDPTGFYVNLHTMANTAGVIRGQLTSVTAPVAIQQSSAYFLETGDTDAQISLLISSSDLAAVLTSTVLINGQPATSQFDVATGTFNVTIPAELRSNAGTLFVQARGATGLASAPVAIVVAEAGSVNAVPLTTTDAAKFGVGEAAPEAIVAGFGTMLASQTVAATTQPLPTTLDGTSVYVNGIAARLFFVSANQVNYLVPAGTLPGQAEVVAVAKDGAVSRGQLNISHSTPAIFTSNSTGTGAPAAVASADGQVFDIVVGNPDGTPVEIEAGSFVALFGTGLRSYSTPLTAAATIGTTTFDLLFAGAQGGFDGLDQINLQIPQSLAGAGEVDLVIKIDGKNTNPVKLKIK